MMGMKGRVISLFWGVGVFLNCALDEPKAPSWEVDLQIPLTSQHVSIDKLLSSQSSLFAYKDGLVGLRAEGSFDTSRVGDNLKIPDIAKTIDVDIPNFTIPRLNADDASFALKELSPDITALDGQDAAIPAFQFSDAVGYLVPENDVISIRLTQGIARLVYENNLPVDLHNIVFTLIEPSNGEIKITTPRINRIAAGEKDSLDVDISGKELTCNGKWYAAGESPGSNGARVKIDADASVSLQVDFIDFRVSSVTGRGSAFYVEHEDSVDLDPKIQIGEAQFKQGRITFDVMNGLPLNLDVTITSPQIRNRLTNEPLELLINAALRKRSKKSINLRDYKIDFGQELERPQWLVFTFEAGGESDNDEIVTMSENDRIQVDCHIQDAVFDNFYGSLDHYAVSIAPVNHKVNMPENLNQFKGLNLADAKLLLNFYNAMAMPIQMRGKFVGISGDGQTATLELDSIIDPGTDSGETLTSISFESLENKQVLNLVNLIPQQIQFTGSAFIGDGITMGAISGDSYIRGEYVLETPVKLAWNESALEPDTTFLQIDPVGSKESDLRPGAVHLNAKQMNVLREFVITAEIENHLPVGATIEYRLQDMLAQTEEADLILSPVEINSASIDLSGRTEESFKRTAKITIGNDDIVIFHNDFDSPRLLSLVSRIRLHGTKGEQVKVYESDYMKITSMAKLVVGVNME